MKEPAGEANMTVITIVLIGVVAAVGLVLIPRMMNKIRFQSCCIEAGGYTLQCPESERSDRLCCAWRSDDRDYEAFRSAFNECGSAYLH